MKIRRFSSIAVFIIGVCIFLCSCSISPLGTDTVKNDSSVTDGITAVFTVNSTDYVWNGENKKINTSGGYVPLINKDEVLVPLQQVGGFKSEESFTYSQQGDRLWLSWGDVDIAAQFMRQYEGQTIMQGGSVANSFIYNGENYGISDNNYIVGIASVMMNEHIIWNPYCTTTFLQEIMGLQVSYDANNGQLTITQ